MRKYVSDEGESFREHIKSVDEKTLLFETAFESVSRMFLSGGIEKPVVNGQLMYDYLFFREGEKHVVAMYEVLNAIVSYVGDAAKGGSGGEMALILVGEPGNGKTFTIEYIMKRYRRWLRQQENKRKTFRFINLEEIGGYGNFTTIRSQTYEDPFILAMNLFEDSFDEPKENIKWLEDNFKISSKTIENAYKKYRPLGACSEYLWQEIREHTGGDPKEMLKYVLVENVALGQSLGTITGKYPAKDKITSSAADLVGELDMMRELQLSDPQNPYKYNLQAGALARVAGGGIHFSDETFKNKKDLVQVYLGVIQNRKIESDGYEWPIDTLIFGTSNNAEFQRFLSEKEESPIIDRCRIIHVGHNTDVILQKELTKYSIGREVRTAVGGENLHQDPNTEYAASAFVVLTRLPHSKKATSVELMKLASGQTAGDKSVKTLTEIIDELNNNAHVEMRFAQTGIGQRQLGRAFQLQVGLVETQEHKCLHALDFFDEAKRVIMDAVVDQNKREKYLIDLKTARGLYRERIKVEMFNALMENKFAIAKDVMNYVNMIIGVDSERLTKDKMWGFKDPLTGERKAIKIDENYIKAVEERLELKSDDMKKTYRERVRRLYNEKITNDPEYDFMDERDLVKAVTEVRLNSDIAGASSLMGALANRTNEENRKLYDRIIGTMCDSEKGLGYCKTCAEKTIIYYTTQEDES